MFSTGLQNAVRNVLGQKSAAPEDIMSNALFQSRWAEVTKMRGEEIIAEALNNRLAGAAINAEHDESVIQRDAVDLTAQARGSKGIERCAPDTKDYWDCFAAQNIRQYCKLIVEPKSGTALETDIAQSALNIDFRGEKHKSTILIILEADNLTENALRPIERKPMPDQTVIQKLLQGVLKARGGTMAEDSTLCTAPAEQDIVMLCDGGRDACKSALHGT